MLSHEVMGSGVVICGDFWPFLKIVTNPIRKRFHSDFHPLPFDFDYYDVAVFIVKDRPIPAVFQLFVIDVFGIFLRILFIVTIRLCGRNSSFPIAPSVNALVSLSEP